MADSINWRVEAEQLADLLRSFRCSTARDQKAVNDAVERCDAAKLRERNREAAAKQGDMFAGPDIPSRPSQRQDTSIEAAGSYSAATAQRTRSAVLTQITRRPSTDEEIATALSMEGNSVRPRRIELVERGLVHDSGTRRLTKAKRRAIVWELVRS